jgi:hypothetical protein
LRYPERIFEFFKKIVLSHNIWHLNTQCFNVYENFIFVTVLLTWHLIGGSTLLGLRYVSILAVNFRKQVPLRSFKYNACIKRMWEPILTFFSSLAIASQRDLKLHEQFKVPFYSIIQNISALKDFLHSRNSSKDINSDLHSYSTTPNSSSFLIFFSLLSFQPPIFFSFILSPYPDLSYSDSQQHRSPETPHLPSQPPYPHQEIYENT